MSLPPDMDIRHGSCFKAGAFSLSIAAFCFSGLLSCAQKQADVQKLEMEMLATATADSLAQSLDTAKLLTQSEPNAIPDSETLAEEAVLRKAAAQIAPPDSSGQVEQIDSTSIPTDDTIKAAVTTDSETRFDPDQVPEDTGQDEPKFERRPGAYVGSGGYTLQIASTDSRGYAEELVNLFRQRGYQPYITELSVDGATRYRVRIGQYANSVEAQEALHVLEQDYGVVGWVDRVR